MIIDGKSVASSIYKELEHAIMGLKDRRPCLAFILVGDNPASRSYVKAKQKACLLTGIRSILIELPIDTEEKELCNHIEKLNKDREIDGILVQLPLPSRMNEQTIMQIIDPKKDVDGFHPLNIGKMLLGHDDGFLPCTPHGIKVLLERSQIPLAGKHVVVVGRSNIVGKPLGAMLVQKKPSCNATVTIAHSQSERLIEICRSADILVAAIGKPRFITEKMIRPNAVVIDVGINRLADGKLVGDVDFENVAQVASKITPVPGGVGPMTIAMLLQNTFLSYMIREKLE